MNQEGSVAPTQFGARLRACREARGLAPATVDEYLGVMRGSCTNWENGYAAPEEELLEELAGYYRVRVSELKMLQNVEKKAFGWYSPEKVTGEEKKTMARKSYTEEEKQAILKRAAETNISAAAKEFGVSRMAITNWQKNEKVGEIKEKIEDVKEKIEDVRDTVDAEKIEAKKTIRKGGRKAKEAVEELKDKAEEAKEAVEEAKEKIRRGGRKAKKVVEELKDKAEEVKEAVNEKKPRGRKKAEKVATEEKPAEEAVTAAEAAPAEEKPVDAAPAEDKPVDATSVEEKAAEAEKPTTQIFIQSAFGHEITPEAILAKVGEVDSVYIRVDQNKMYWVKGEENGAVDIWD